MQIAPPPSTNLEKEQKRFQCQLLLLRKTLLHATDTGRNFIETGSVSGEATGEGGG